MTELGSEPEDKNGEPAPLAPDGSTLTLQQDIDGATDRPTPADVAPPTTGLRSKAPRESIIERYFSHRGFIRSLEGQFRHPDGSVIVRSPGDPFPWAEHNESGELVCHYWAKEVCLECQPLELDVEIWGMIHKFPGLHAMILASPGGDPAEYSGRRLVELLAARKLVLHQATYRLVLHQDEHE